MADDTTTPDDTTLRAAPVKAPRKRAAKKVAPAIPEAPAAAPAGPTESAPPAEAAAPTKATPRKRAAKKVAPALPELVAPPVETPPVETPPVETPPVETPPIQIAPIQTAPIPDAPIQDAIPRRRTRAVKKVADPFAITLPAAAETPAAETPAAETPAAETPAAETPAAAGADGAPVRTPRKRTPRKATASTSLADSVSDTAPAADVSAPVPPPVLFQAPDVTAAPTRRRRAASAPAGPPPAETDETETETETAEADPDEVEDAVTGEGSDEDVRDVASEEAAGARRRRRRGRRGRGSRPEDAEADETTAAPTGSDDDDDAETVDSAPEDAATEEESEDTEEGTGGSASARRRRRRRRSAGGGTDQSGDAEDPPNTVVHVREPRAKKTEDTGDDGVKGVRGSTRLEAKRQRRRDGRDSGRRRPSILSEAEFLARRESVERVMAVRELEDRTQIAVLEDGVLVEHYVTQASATSYVGNVYLGRVQNVLPSMEAAFIDIGKGRNGVLYAGEVNWDAAGLEGKSRTIEHALSSGDAVLVQVTKDPVGHKGARLTSQVSLPGRFLVYVPNGGMTGISRKLPDTERSRLKAILKKIVPEDAGVIIRTAAEGASEEDLTHDVERLKAQWESIQAKTGAPKSAPMLVNGEPDLAIRVVRDVFNEDFTSLVVQGEQVWQTVSGYVSDIAPDLAERVSRHTGADLFYELRVDEQLAKGLDRKVYLPSGGSLVIDRTEAMTVVDVNTGKFVGSGGNLEQTVTRNNLEAAEEIVRQLRLRDVGGIIVIDFIDMVLESNRDLVLRRLTECLGRDRTKHQVAEVTSLGLVQMTRKRVGEGLLEAFSEPCEACRGRGVIVHSEPVAIGPSEEESSTTEEARGGGKRRNRRGRAAGATAEPEIDEPPMTEEQRAAARSAMAAIHSALAAGQVHDAAQLQETVEAITATPEPVDEDPVDGGWVDDVSIGDVSIGDVSIGGVSVDGDSADEIAQIAVVDGPVVDDSEDVAVVEQVAGLPEVEVAEGAAESANGHGLPGLDTIARVVPALRRRRAASRPAGPPVSVPDTGSDDV